MRSQTLCALSPQHRMWLTRAGREVGQSGLGMPVIPGDRPRPSTWTRRVPMPADDRVGLHEVHGIAPVGEHPLHQDPEHAVAVVDLRPLDGPFQYGELVTQGDVLKGEALAVLEEEPQEEDDVAWS